MMWVMARQQSTAQILRFNSDPGNARDELNLCEFPLALLSNRAPDDCNMLTFTDKVWDECRQKEVERSLLVIADGLQKGTGMVDILQAALCKLSVAGANVGQPGFLDQSCLTTLVRTTSFDEFAEVLPQLCEFIDVVCRG